MALKIRRGTQAQRLNIVPAEGELIYDTTQNKLYVGNGSTAGGTEVVGGVIGGSLGSNVNLGGYDITGTGNINITGTITASGTITGNGDLVLGNADTDNVQFGADINSNIVPNSGSLTIGTSAKPWNTTFTQNISNDSNPIDVLSTLRPNEDIVPDATGTLSLGSTSARWDEVYGNNLYTQGLRIYQNTIVATESGADLTLTPHATGSVVSSRLGLSEFLEVGEVPTNLTTISNLNGIRYNFNKTTERYSVSDQGSKNSYTQLVTNAAENITLLQIPVDPLNVNDVDAYELTIKFKNSAGSQIIKLIGTYFNTTSTIVKIDEAIAGTAPVSSVSTTLSGGVFTILATTNTTTNAGEVTDYQVKITTFNSVN